jgi:hypothetical protein
MAPRLAHLGAVFGGLCLVAAASSALAWGATGHRIIGELGVVTLPPETPAFLHSLDVAKDVGELAREPDRWRGSGKTHDSTRDPGHFVNVDDSGKISGGPALNDLPSTRGAYETALRAVGTDTAKAGYLPYAIVDGWQQLTKDFAYWRVLDAAIPRERNAERKAWLERDMARREALTLNDLGVWAHYVGDASQPMHVSIHYNGWGHYPNPEGYTQERVHMAFEGEYVHRFVSLEQAFAAMAPSKPCEDAIEVCTARYLAATQATVEPYFALRKAGGFVGGDSRGQVFARERVAAGAAALRDFIISAWRASAHASVGYPALSVDQVVNHGADPFEALYGDD